MLLTLCHPERCARERARESKDPEDVYRTMQRQGVLSIVLSPNASKLSKNSGFQMPIWQFLFAATRLFSIRVTKNNLHKSTVGSPLGDAWVTLA